MRVSARLFFVFVFAPLLLVGNGSPQPQQQHSVYMAIFLDKAGVTFDPAAYFHPKALARRAKLAIPSTDSTDFPVNPAYKAKVSARAAQTLGDSRWLNAIFFRSDEAAASEISSLSCVASVIKLGAGEMQKTSARKKIPASGNEDLSPEQMKTLRLQTERMQCGLFHKAGFKGEGVRVAVFDAGFTKANERPELAHIFEGSNIAETHDFVRKGKPFQYKYSAHGTMVLSCIGGVYNDIPIGLAPNAEFLLARTEHWLFEPAAEEIYWLKAAEWADKHGADIINSSLGYTESRYFYHDLNGETAIVTRAANMAARKGILVVNAAGNEGDVRWNYIGAPADADSVLAVGGTDPYTDAKIDFSSWGPTIDGRRKPNVSAFGQAAVCGPNGMTIANGTSFACPLVAGFAACALQSNPKTTGMALFSDIEKSGHLYPYFDYAHGYGIPQASAFLSPNASSDPPRFEFRVEGRTLHVILNDERVNSKAVKNIYYNFQRPDGTLDYFAVHNAQSRIALNIPLSALEPNKIINVHYEGYTASFDPKQDSAE